ncbi:DUF1190 domain-containing protein [Desertibaculum subflavum]|uniref:DUF1190 domain-containing protein n=1 Tax=Desertibaculum subflavum TaxID=2268458 RepID=UPI0013C46367
MRRSRRIATLLVGTATLLVLTACDEDPASDAKLYSDLEACKVENTPEECDKAFGAAKAFHAQETPRYRSQAECEDLFGQGRCEQAPAVASGLAGQSTPGQPTPGQTAPGQTASTGSFFMPALMGFMLGRSMSGFGSSAGYPVYADRQGYVYAGRQQLGTCVPPQNCPRPMGSTSSTRTGATGISSSSGRYAISSAGTGTEAASRAATRGGFGTTASRMSSSSGS